MYDYCLGGKDSFAVDRRAVEMIRAVIPEWTQAAWANRGFHQRAAIWMAGQGIRQYIDVGCGLFTAETTHQAVQKVRPDAKVAYIDHDSMVIAQALALLTEPGSTVTLADVRDPASLLAAIHLDGLIEMAEPVGLLCTAVLDHVADDHDPHGCLARLMSALAPGSYVALSHLTGDRMPPVAMAAIAEAYQNASEHLYPRDRAEVAKFFSGLDLVPPYGGAIPELCRIGLWGAEDPSEADDDSSQWWWAAVARLPRTATPAAAGIPVAPTVSSA